MTGRRPDKMLFRILDRSTAVQNPIEHLTAQRAIKRIPTPGFQLCTILIGQLPHTKTTQEETEVKEDLLAGLAFRID